MPEYVMGIDLGGSGARCLLVNLATRETHTAHCAWSPIPEPEFGRFAYRLDPDAVWQAIAEATRAVLRQAGVHPAQVAGLAVAGMRHTTVALDATGRVLLMTPNRDARAAGQAIQLAADHGEAIQAATGHYPNPIFLAARLLWLREEQPRAFDSLALVMSLSDWAGYRMTGASSAEYAQAGETLLLDIHQRMWAQPLLRSLEIPDRILPPLRMAGERLGDLTRAAADDLGLSPGTPVAVGGPDTQCGLLGMGILAPGEVGILAGTTAPVQWVTDRPITADGRLWAGLHLIPGRYVLESNAGSMGATLDWLARLCFAADPRPTARWFAEAEAAPQPTADAYSTIGARCFDARALAMPVDTLTFAALAAESLPNATPQFARAVVEGMAYALRANLEQIGAVAGGSAQRLGLAGGMTRSRFWKQLLTDVLGQAVYVSAVAEASALGAAICAGVGAGLFDSLPTAAQALMRPAEAHRPGAQSPTYHRLYAAWSRFYQARREADALAGEHITEAVLEAPTVQQAAPMPGAFRPRIFVSAEMDEPSLAQLSRLADVTYRPYREAGAVLTGDELVQALQGCHVFVTEVDVVDAEALLQLPDLRAVIACRGNPVNVDVEACSLAGVLVAHTPARNADAVADLAVAFILALARKLPSALAFLHQPGGEAGDLGRLGQAHEAFLGVELWRKTIGLIGGGAVGRKVAARLLPFGARVLIYDPFLSESQVTRMGAEKVSLAQLLAQSDFVSLHAPVTDETRGMINAQTLAQMKPGAFLVNTARAALVDEAAVCQALHQGRLGGYATDVFAVEPPAADDPLLNAPNVVATPHIGGNTRQVAAHQGEAVTRALTQLLAGQAPDHALNPEVMRSFRWHGPRATDEAALRRRRQHPGPAVTDLEAAAAERRASPSAAEAATAAQAPALPSHPAKPASAPPATNETQQKVLALLDDFTRRVAADAELATFAKGKQVTFLFTLKDLDQTFYLSFIDGKVSAGMGTPPVDAEVRLKTTTEVLDGIFTGRVNPTKAALSGKLSFSGDTARAMAFMRIQGHVSRLYAQARAAVGELGNLAELTSPASAPPPTPARSAPAVLAMPTPTSVSSAGDPDALHVVKITQELYAKGLITATGGNVSARCADKPDEIWITPSGLFKGELRPEMLVRINLDGQVVRPTEYTASSELRIHCAIYRKMPDAQAVIHSHPEYATLMALVGMKFEPISTEAAFIGELPVVPFIMPGSEALAEAVSEAMRKHGLAVLMQNHGMVVAGSSLRRAADWTENIEIAARKLVLCRLLGKRPARIPDATVRLLREIGASIG